MPRSPHSQPPPLGPDGQRPDLYLDLPHIVQTMREMSRQTDPQRMVQLYGQRMDTVMPVDRYISLSRRDLARPWYRITRSDFWQEHPDPWKNRDRLPLFDRGLLGELIYGEEPVLLDDLTGVVKADDPAADYFAGMGSLMALPMYDTGLSLNMVVSLRKGKKAFDRARLPELVWMSSLFGRATSNLVLSRQLQEAYETVDRELKVVADIQRSLLPAELPKIPGLELACHYQTSRRAGGDYYDFFELPDGRWGILIADVAGHGTPAAVMMAVTHSIAHTHHEPPDPPCRLLHFLNQQLVKHYTRGTGTFVTAFYGIYDPAHRTLDYCSAGHNPPRVRTCDQGIRELRGARHLPLGIDPDERYSDEQDRFNPGDLLVFYTDGITEARRDATGDFFGVERLDEALRDCTADPNLLLQRLLLAVEAFTGGQAPSDDRTLLLAKVGSCTAQARPGSGE